MDRDISEEDFGAEVIEPEEGSSASGKESLNTEGTDFSG